VAFGGLGALTSRLAQLASPAYPLRRQTQQTLYPDLIRSPIFCDDEHSVVVRAELKEFKQALSLQKFLDTPKFLPALFPFKLLGRKGRA
jgi:hypothetical protein